MKLTYYVLQKPYFDETYSVYGSPDWDREFGRADWADEVQIETIRCPMYPGHQRAGERIGHLAIVLPSRKLGDFTWTPVSDCIITDAVRQLFEKTGLAGFRVNPVRVVPKTKKGKPSPQPVVLWELIVTGKGGDADPRSGIQRIYTCPHCGLTKYSSFRNGILVNERTWDGSDFFTVTGYPKFILVTERVKELVVRHALTNCVLIPSQEMEWGSFTRPEDLYGGLT